MAPNLQSNSAEILTSSSKTIPVDGGHFELDKEFEKEVPGQTGFMIRLPLILSWVTREWAPKKGGA